MLTKKRLAKNLGSFIREIAKGFDSDDKASAGWVGIMGAIRFVEYLLGLTPTSLVEYGLQEFILALPEEVSTQRKTMLLQGTSMMMSGVLASRIHENSGSWDLGKRGEKAEKAKEKPQPKPTGPVDGLTPEEARMMREDGLLDPKAWAAFAESEAERGGEE